MKKYAFTFSGHQEFSDTITRHNFLLRCMPGTYPFQRSYANRLTVTPYTALTHIADVYGNEMYTGTIDKKHMTFTFTASGFVLCSKYLTHEPLDRLYLYPSALTQPTADMQALLDATILPAEDLGKAEALCHLTHKLLTPTEDGSPTAGESFLKAAGNARDFAHVFLTLCRMSGVAARFVTGLAVGISRVHYWAEVYCGGTWRAMDPWSGKTVEEGYLKIAHGPDYAACAEGRGCYREQADGVTITRSMHVQVTEHVIRTRDTVPHA